MHSNMKRDKCIALQENEIWDTSEKDFFKALNFQKNINVAFKKLSINNKMFIEYHKMNK